jgi:hypothetical protein
LSAVVLAKPPVEDPDRLELNIPSPHGPIIPGEGRRVIVPIEGQQPEVCSLIGEVDDRYMAMRPNGELTAVVRNAGTLTDRPFASVSPEQLTKSVGSRFKGFRTHQTKRFVYVYNTSDIFYVGVSRILETMYPALYSYWERLGVEVHEPETPMLVIMFRTYSEYAQFRPMEEGVIAYYSPILNYVVMYENSPQSLQNPAVFQKLAIGVVAHEGTHQILANIGVQGRLAHWPLWIQEGLAEYFGSTELKSGIRWKGVGSVNDFRMGELEFYIADNAGKIAAGDTLNNTVRKLDFSSTDYAIAWAMVHFLAQKRQPAFFGYLKEVCQTEPLQILNPVQSEALFVKHFGDDFATMENELIRHLKTLPYVNPYVRVKPKSSSSSSSKK